ncbi:MAG: hemolysin family protein [Anaerolineae bacterium]
MLDQNHLVLLGLFLFCLLVHGWSAYALAVISNVRRTPLAERNDAGDPVAGRILRLSDDFTRFSSTINVLQWYCRVGMTASLVFALGLPLFNAFSIDDGNIMPFLLLVLLLVVGTLIVLWLSSTIPHAYGLAHADQHAPMVSLLAGPVMAIMSPFVGLTTRVANGAARLAGAESIAKAVTEEEIIALVDSGQRGGAIETEEKEMIYSVLQFGETLVREVMIPRPDVVALPLETTVQASLKIFMESGHSRAPVYLDDLDDVRGILYAKDLLAVWQRGEEPTTIAPLLRSAYFVPETKRADVLFKDLQQRKIHIAIVVDEYGGTAGLVTIEDLLEEIVGDIRDEFDIHEEADFTKLADNEYVVDGAMNLGDFNEELGVDVPDEESDSVGGHIYSLLGHVPQVGEVVDDPEHRLRMVVESVANRRIRKVHVTVLLPPGDSEDDESEAPRGRRSNGAKENGES